MDRKEMNRKESIRQYKETARPAGIFRIRNTASGRSLVGSSPNLPAILNRQRFQLENGSHPDKELQADYSALGAGSFEFEELDRLAVPEDQPDYDPTEDLRVLKDLWLERLTDAGVDLYPQSRWRA
ncbi:MAG: GIY-YIG nuclease family protein [Candidatus Eisenbacteria bacterium]